MSEKEGMNSEVGEERKEEEQKEVNVNEGGNNEVSEDEKKESEGNESKVESEQVIEETKEVNKEEEKDDDKEEQNIEEVKNEEVKTIEVKEQTNEEKGKEIAKEEKEVNKEEEKDGEEGGNKNFEEQKTDAEVANELEEENIEEVTNIDEILEGEEEEEEEEEDPALELELEAKVEKLNEVKDKLISYILLAEFDIDKGSTLKAQYPKALVAPKDYTGTVDYFDYIADLMLPDGSQNQEWDQTLFIVNRPPPKVIQSVLWDLPMDDDEPAIEELELEVTGSKLIASISQPNLMSGVEAAEEGVLFGLNIIHCKKDSSVRRGATIKAITILSKYGELFGNAIGSGLVPVMRKAILEFFNNGRKRSPKRVFRDVYLAVNNAVDLSRYLHAVDLLPNLKYSISPHFQSFNCEVLGEVFPIVISYTACKDTLGMGSLYTLLRFIGLENAMELYHAVLLEKKILFFGHNFPVGQLCKFVLSSSILVGPALVNIVVNRVFPYINLTDLSFESVPGFIAGTTNPVLLNTCPYDVLVNLNDRSVTWRSSSPIALHHQQLQLQQQQTQQQQQRPSNNPLKFFKPVLNEAQKFIVKDHPDNEFMRKIEQGFNLRLSERWLHHQFSEYTIRYIDVALGASEVSKADVDLFSSRSILIASTNWFNQYYSDVEVRKANGYDVAGGVRQLLFAKKNYQYTRAQKCEAVAKVLTAFNSNIVSNSDVLLLISSMLKYNGEANINEEIDLVEEFYLRYSNSSLHARKINLRMQNLISAKISPSSPIS